MKFNQFQRIRRLAAIYALPLLNWPFMQQTRISTAQHKCFRRQYRMSPWRKPHLRTPRRRSFQEQLLHDEPLSQRVSPPPMASRATKALLFTDVTVAAILLSGRASVFSAVCTPAAKTRRHGCGQGGRAAVVVIVQCCGAAAEPCYAFNAVQTLQAMRSRLIAGEFSRYIPLRWNISTNFFLLRMWKQLTTCMTK